jgi:hypothetical protein
MLKHFHQWKKPLHFPARSRISASLSSLIFTKSSVSTAELYDEPTTPSAVPNPTDTVREIIYGLRSFGLRRFLGGDYFRAVVLTLDWPQVDQIIDVLRVESPEFAVGFFHLLKDWYRFRHSRVSWFAVSHLLAGERRFKELQLVIKQMVEEEGMAFHCFF